MKYITFLTAALFGFSFQGFAADSKSPQTSGEEFAVQILLSGNHLQPSNKKFKGVADIHEEICDGLFKYKYTTGHEAKTFQEAAAVRLKMIDAGFTDAFVVRYHDGKRILTNTLVKTKPVNSEAPPLAAKPVNEEPKSTAEPTESKTKVVIGTSVIQVKPQFRGGEDALESFISNNLHYPDSAFDKNHSAQVFLSFTVDYKGKIKNPKIVGSLNDELDKEALRVIGKMPAWEPGTIGGMPVNMDCFLPVDFHAPDGKRVEKGSVVSK